MSAARGQETLWGPAPNLNGLYCQQVSMRATRRRMFLCRREKFWKLWFHPRFWKWATTACSLFCPRFITLHSPYRIHLPRHNLCASIPSLSHIYYIFLIYPAHFQISAFSYCQIASLPAILNTTLATQFPALPPTFFPFEAPCSVCISLQKGLNTQPMFSPVCSSNFLLEGNG